jgi:hypothetical protein
VGFLVRKETIWQPWNPEQKKKMPFRRSLFATSFSLESEKNDGKNHLRF